MRNSYQQIISKIKYYQGSFSKDTVSENWIFCTVSNNGWKNEMEISHQVYILVFLFFSQCHRYFRPNSGPQTRPRPFSSQGWREQQRCKHFGDWKIGKYDDSEQNLENDDTLAIIMKLFEIKKSVVSSSLRCGSFFLLLVCLHACDPYQRIFLQAQLSINEIFLLFGFGLRKQL